MRKKKLLKFKECKFCGKMIQSKKNVCEDCEIIVREEYNPEAFSDN